MADDTTYTGGRLTVGELRRCLAGLADSEVITVYIDSKSWYFEVDGISTPAEGGYSTVVLTVCDDDPTASFDTRSL